MSARTEPCGDFVILTTTLSLSYALHILFLYRVLYMCLRNWHLLAQPFHFLFKVMDHGEVIVSIRVYGSQFAQPRCHSGFAHAIVYGQATTSYHLA